MTQIFVALGQHVAKGQPLAMVQSADYATAVSAYRKAVVAAANARRLARYAEAVMAGLAALDDAALRSASFGFPPPARVSALP